MKKTLLLAACLISTTAITQVRAETPAAEPAAKNAYERTNFYANKAKYAPTFGVEPKMINAWGVAIRPKGAGGHFWITAKDVSYEYVGDVSASADEKLRTLHQDKLKTVSIPTGGDDKFTTGVVFSDSKDAFVITQQVSGVEPITAPAKFLFASDGGIISAWTERKLADGSFDRSGKAENVIDQSKEGAQFFGLALSHDYSRLYAANFGDNQGIQVFDGKFKPAKMTFDAPFDDNKNGKVDPGEYAPFNVQALTTPAGENHIFVAYAKTKACDAEAAAKKECAKVGEMFAGEEDTDKPGQGRVAEFTEDGKLVTVWKDGGKLSAPWGMAFAPASFGKLGGQLLVGNFGDGTIAAFDPSTHAFVDVIRDAKNKPLEVEKVWGILFGNGESLGDANTLYFAAGPDDEKDGVWGKIRAAK